MIDVNKLLEKIEQNIFDGDTHEEYKPSPCYEVKIENNEFIFLVDEEEVARCSSIGFSLNYDDLKPTLAQCFDFMREKNIRGLKGFMKR